MSPENFKNRYQFDKPSKDTEIIFSCRGGRRSVEALKLALELGYHRYDMLSFVMFFNINNNNNFLKMFTFVSGRLIIKGAG